MTAPDPSPRSPGSAFSVSDPLDPRIDVSDLPGGGEDRTERSSVRATPPAPPPSNRVRPIHLALAVVALLAGAALFVSGYSLGARVATTPGTPAGEQAAFQPFWDSYDAITHLYVGKADQKTVIQGAIRGMFQSLNDPYSAYLSPADFQNTLQDLAGQFQGIGATIGTQKPDGTASSCSPLGPECQMVVVAPLPGSPSEQAGLRTGDRIIAIDGTKVDGMTLDAATSKVRGPKGTVVKLTVQRGTRQLTISITRQVITEKEVVARTMAGGTVGYIKLSGFSPTSGTDFVTALTNDIKAGRKKIVIDLRDNPGGYVDAARKIASQFLSSGTTLFWEQDATGSQTPTVATAGGVATDASIKVVVLINKGSASASEIVAGALQDDRRATLVGESSYGKGTVQEWITLPDDAGGFRLSIAKWLTPDKHWVYPKGLTPDVRVTIPPNAPLGSDPVLDRALEVLGAPATASVPLG